MRQGKLTLQKCIEIAKSDEVSNMQLKNMDQPTQEDVHKVKFPKPKKTEQEKKYPKYPKQPDRRNPNRKPIDDKMSTSHKACDYCGRKHRRGRATCTAWGRVCGACGKENHFASQCKARERTHNVEVEDESSEEFLYCVTTLPEITETVNSVSEREIYAKMLINEKPIKFHIDCGTRVNVLPSKYANKEDIKPTKHVLQMWNKTELKPEGICYVTICNPKNRKKYSVEFIVVKENLTPLLGAKAIQHMELIEVHEENFKKVAAAKIASTKAQTAEEIIDEYSDVF